MQGYEESCGASALATIMNFYGNSYTEEDIIDAIRKTDMLNFNEMANIARRMNFEAGGFKIDKDIFNNLEIPVIARVDNRENYAHFVVVQNHNGDFVSVFDPNSGYYIQSKKDFFDLWVEEDNGYILIVKPVKSDKLPNINLNIPNRNLFIK
nr:cysteine peptidase family C39 domain-containing protein [Campylobacter sp. RM16188]